MAIQVDWPSRVITVPQADLTPLGGTEYELDLDAFRLALKDLEDGEDGMTFPDTHVHNPPLTVGGVTLAQTIEIINSYTVTFEDGQYTVTLTGANSNVLDVVNQNQVSIRSANSAGLIVSGSGVTAQDKVDIALAAEARIMDLTDGAETGFTVRQGIRLLLAALAGEIARSGQDYSIKALGDGLTERLAGAVDSSGNRSVTSVDGGA